MELSKYDKYEIRAEVMTVDDVVRMVPRLASHRRLVERLLRRLSIDKVNAINARNCATPGVPFTDGLLRDLNITLRVDNEEILSQFSEGAFITVSNHPFGALDGISLISLVGRYRPDFKVMVNMVLNAITAMRPNFIAVDALASDDPAKKAVSMHGIRQAIMQVRRGRPLGFFPAGAVSKIGLDGRLSDRDWQPSVIRLIDQLKVPVIPIYFHGSNSWWFNLLGRISWQLRTLRLPAEVFRRHDSEIRISVGRPITVEEQQAHAGTVEQLAEFLKSRTYQLRKLK